jgi:hypothetical protein
MHKTSLRHFFGCPKYRRSIRLRSMSTVSNCNSYRHYPVGRRPCCNDAVVGTHATIFKNTTRISVVFPKLFECFTPSVRIQYGLQREIPNVKRTSTS